jgi:hypothetical protein
MSIRGNRELPPLRDLDPLEISDAGPDSLLLELIGGGEDATIRYIGNALKADAEVEQIAEARRPSILACIAKKLSIVAISRNFLAFEDEFARGGATTRCWVTLLPLSSAGAWVDYVYAFVTFDADAAPAQPDAAIDELASESEVLELAAEDELAVEPETEALELTETVDVQPVEAMDTEAEAQPPLDEQPSVEAAAAEAAAPTPAKVSAPRGKTPSFSFDTIAAAGGFYATKAVKVGSKAAPGAAVSDETPPVEKVAPAVEEVLTPVEQQQTAPIQDEDSVPATEEPVPAPIADEEAAPPPHVEQPSPSPASEGTLQSKLEDVRVKADEARQAKLRANVALYEGLSAAYDFALDAESSPEEYLKMCEAKGLKIQLRSPMKPVAKLAFDGMCDDSTIAQLETVLDWALKHDLPKGSLAERIEEEGGLAPILGQAKAA